MLKEYFIKNKLNLSDYQTDLVEKYYKLLIAENEKVNLISRKDTANAIENHIIPCLVFCAHIKEFSGDFLDIGTGGGLPGILFGIIHPNSKGVLLDSTQKKIKAVNYFISELGLTNIRGYCSRAEDKEFVNLFRNRFGLIISRATADMKTLLEYSNPLLNRTKKSALYALKGGEITAELNEAAEKFPRVKFEKIPMPYFPANENNENEKYIIKAENF